MSFFNYKSVQAVIVVWIPIHEYKTDIINIHLTQNNSVSAVAAYFCKMIILLNLLRS